MSDYLFKYQFYIAFDDDCTVYTEPVLKKLYRYLVLIKQA